MSSILNDVINECCKDTGIDLVLEVDSNILVICTDGQSRVIDKDTDEVTDITEIQIDTNKVKILPIEDSKKSILGKKIYTMNDIGHIVKLLRVWKDLDLELFAYSVDFDEQLVDGMLEYIIMQIKKGMRIGEYTEYLNVFFKFDREMAVAYCKGYTDIVRCKPSGCKLQTPYSQKLEDLLNTEQFCDKFVNYICKSGESIYIFMEDPDYSVILNLTTGEQYKMTEILLPTYLFEDDIEEVHISDERYGAANYFIGAHKFFTQRSVQEVTKANVAQAIILQRFNLDTYFSSVNYDTKMCETVVKYMYEIFNSETGSRFRVKLDSISEHPTIKKFFEYTDKRMAMAYIEGCYDMGVM